jgi:hypothetical protein
MGGYIDRREKRGVSTGHVKLPPPEDGEYNRMWSGFFLLQLCTRGRRRMRRRRTGGSGGSAIGYDSARHSDAVVSDN